MTVIIEYDIDTKQAERFFEYAGYKARRTSQPIHLVKSRIEDIIHEQFASQGELFPSPGEFQWAPLAESTIRNKGFDRILYEKGNLQREAEGGVHAGSDWVQLRVDSFTRDGHSLVELHQGGTPRMPSRPIWQTTERFEEEVKLIFWTWLYELKSANLRRRDRPNDVSGLSVIPSYRAF